MSKKRRYFLAITLLIAAFALTTLSSTSQAQEETPTEAPPDEIFVEVSPPPVEVPTEAPPEALPSPESSVPEPPTATPIEQITPEPTIEPTLEVTEVPTGEATAEVIETPSVEATAAVTEEMTTAPGETPTLPPPTDIPTEAPLPAEPPLTLLFEDTFDSGALDLWTLGAGWSLVPSEGGQALQVVSSVEALTFVHDNLFNVAVQARFFISVGSARLTVRQSSAGQYTASLGADGLVELYRAGGLVQSVSVTPAADQWHTLRLSAMDGVLRVAVDGVEVIAVLDSALLPPGAVLIAGSADGALLVDDVSLWMPTSEVPPADTLEISAMAEALAISPLVVTNINDSGEGSLRSAIEYANTNPGADTITFNIPGTGPHTIRPLTPLPFLLDATSIDGSSQPGASCAAWPPTLMIELDGSAIPIPGQVDGLTIAGSNSTVRGLVINRFPTYGILLDSSYNVVTCNFIGTDVTGMVALGNTWEGVVVFPYEHHNTIGGTDPGAGNLISGNLSHGIDLMQYSRYTNIWGNYIGTNATGSAALGNGIDNPYGFGSGIHTFDAVDVNIGGTTPGTRNIISGNARFGIELTLDDPGEPPNPGGITIRGNYIGTDATGTLPLGNQWGSGIADQMVPAVIIGGSMPEARNIISGNLGCGISAFGPGQPREGNYYQEPAIILGNYIGTDVTGTRPLGNGCGVNTSNGITTRDNLISGNNGTGASISVGADGDDVLTHNTIGADVTGVHPLGNQGDGVIISDQAGYLAYGTSTASDNLIAFNNGAGINVVGLDIVRVTFYVTHSIRSNSIFSNGGLGIDLNGDGVTPNDPGDLNRDTFGLQNYPVLDVPLVGATAVTGRVDTVQLQGETHLIQVFVNDTCNPSGYGEGQRLIGETQINTSASGTAGFTVIVPPLQAGKYITATDSSYVGTSEFSRCVQVQNAILPPRLRYPSANATVNAARLSFSWYAVTGANRYRLQVATDPTFTTLVADVGSDITAAAPVTLQQGAYYWRVQARTPAGNWGAFSEVRRLEFVLMQSPARDTDVHSHQPRFSWYAHPGASRYQLQIDNNSDFSSPESVCIYPHMVLSSPPCGVSGLPYGVYYWRVNVDLGRGFVVSPISWMLIINPETVFGPTHLLPMGVWPPGLLRFSWNPVTGAASYEFQLDDDPTFTSLLSHSIEIHEEEQEIFGLPPGHYYWRVRAWMPYNTPSRWSSVVTFEIRPLY